MITLTLNNDEIRKFNLKSHSDEKRMFAAWRALHGETKKKFKIIIGGKEEFININDIDNCEYDDSILVRGTVGENFNEKNYVKG